MKLPARTFSIHISSIRYTVMHRPIIKRLHGLAHFHDKLGETKILGLNDCCLEVVPYRDQLLEELLTEDLRHKTEIDRITRQINTSVS